MTPARALALLLAISLAAPALAQTDQVAESDIAPMTKAAEPKDDLPPGAPRDDYEFVGWCAGALTGHMALYEQVQPTLREISKRWKTEAQDEKDYAAKQVAGRDLLAQFADAMKTAERASTQALAPRGARAIALGRDKWAAIETVDANARAYSWMNWGLPERCERVAAQLKSRSTLMSAVLRDNSDNAVQASAVRAVGERPPEDADIKGQAKSEPAVEEKPAAAASPAAAKPAAAPAPKPPVKPAPAKSAATPSPAPLRGSIKAED